MKYTYGVAHVVQVAYHEFPNESFTRLVEITLIGKYLEEFVKVNI